MASVDLGRHLELLRECEVLALAMVLGAGWRLLAFLEALRIIRMKRQKVMCSLTRTHT